MSSSTSSGRPSVSRFIFFETDQIGVDFEKVIYYQFDQDDMGDFLHVYFENGSTPLKIRDITREGLEKALALS